MRTYFDGDTFTDPDAFGSFKCEVCGSNDAAITPQAVLLATSLVAREKS
jgi:hypothetical protein